MILPGQLVVQSNDLFELHFVIQPHPRRTIQKGRHCQMTGNVCVISLCGGNVDGLDGLSLHDWREMVSVRSCHEDSKKWKQVLLTLGHRYDNVPTHPLQWIFGFEKG